MSALVPFEGRELAIHMFRGKPCVIAKELGEMLGYSAEGFGNTLRSWKDELVENVDVMVLRGESLAEFRANGEPGGDLFTTQMRIVFVDAIGTILGKTSKHRSRALADAISKAFPWAFPSVAHVRSREHRPSFVYFAESVDSGLVKIGVTVDLKKRIASLQTGHAGALRLVHWEPGDRSDERNAHDAFAEHRVRGEWFRFADPIRKHIASRPSRAAS